MKELASFSAAVIKVASIALYIISSKCLSSSNRAKKIMIQKLSLNAKLRTARSRKFMSFPGTAGLSTS